MPTTERCQIGHDVFASMPIGATLTVSGTGELWALSSDEAQLLWDYRQIRDGGRGSLYVEFSEPFRAIKYDVRRGVGVQHLNVLLTSLRTLRD